MKHVKSIDFSKRAHRESRLSNHVASDVRLFIGTTQKELVWHREVMVVNIATIGWCARIKSCQESWRAMLNLKSTCKAIACFETSDVALTLESGPVVYRCIHDRVREFCGGSQQQVDIAFKRVCDDGLPYVHEVSRRQRPTCAARIAERYRELGR